MDVLMLVGFTEEGICNCEGEYIMAGMDPVRKTMSNFNEFTEGYPDLYVIDIDLNTVDDLEDLYSFVIKEKKYHAHKGVFNKLVFHIECNFDTCTEETALVYKHLVKNIDKYNEFNMISHIKNGNHYMVKNKHIDDNLNVFYSVDEEIVNSINY